MAAETDAVDQFVSRRVQLQHRELVSQLRRLMREFAPDAREEIGYGIPAWRLNKIIAVLSPTKKDITFAFSRGAEFEDRYGLLQGAGKVSKNLKLKTTKDIDEAAFRYYVGQALALDAA